MDQPGVLGDRPPRVDQHHAHLGNAVTRSAPPGGLEVDDRERFAEQVHRYDLTGRRSRYGHRMPIPGLSR
jgi:hypothetical protein